ncbi:hypothetical protein [Coprococcus sp. OM06-25]|uniref:hypothetical protein n=1 Tax=Coprococcus sp. OM06-25 TaxID=2293094 RepID=UPI000E5D93E3|nr:hypothetical protein [Coprococcus sp. OM06-25]RGI41228.1 hypothetical protein DXB88_09930 [Coprococcus sp. OM06-25]
MNSYVAWGIFGIISGFLAAFADVPLVMPKQGENISLLVYVRGGQMRPQRDLGCRSGFRFWDSLEDI